MGRTIYGAVQFIGRTKRVVMLDDAEMELNLAVDNIGMN
jgi:hypothetical protein